MTTPLITDYHELKNVLQFTLSNVNYSMANAIRRTIVSDIPCFVFKTTPYSESKCEITKNTSKFNNEIVKQRLSCIPIHLKDTSLDVTNYTLILNVKNDTNDVMYVTTEHFKIYDEELKKFIDESNVKKIFPADPISNRYIEFIRLKPQISSDLEGEEINLKCKFSVSTAKENGMYNVVSTCAYGNTIDIDESDKHWEKKEKELKKNEIDAGQISVEKKNWNLLNSQRYNIPNSFDFKIETIGVYDNKELLTKSCEILINNLKSLDFESKNIQITDSKSTIANSFDIIFIDQDYTLGKVLEYYMFKNYYENKDEKKLTYCGFSKDHPHNNEIIIRLGFIEETDPSKIKPLFSHVIEESIEHLNMILEQIK
tara:strand:+ start:2604 stop:3713 length:1110 start_codon:yes stop_codon:yes gene_type:complete